MRWTRLSVATLSLAFLVWLGLCATKANGECLGAHELEAGAQAPCRGVLWPRAWTLDAVSCVQVDLPQAKSEHALATAGLADCHKTLKDLQAAYEIHLAKYEDLTRSVAGLGARSWYESPYFWFGLGLVGGGIVVFAIR